MAVDETRGAVPLSDLDDFKVAEGAPDVRGWDVKSDDGRKIGEVKELLVSPAERRVRYLAVELDRDFAGTKSKASRRVLVPIGVARLDERRDDVIIPASAVSSISGLSDWTGGAPTRDYETSLRDRFGAAGTTTTTGTTGTTGKARTTGAAGTATGMAAGAGSSADFYAHEQFDENRFFGQRHPLQSETDRRLVLNEEELAVGKRKVQAGEVSVHKRVETERVQREVPVSHEEVTVERRPITDANRMNAKDASITEDEIRIPVSEEELVVEKRAVPKEEVVIRKKTVTENRSVDEDLRRERVDVDDQSRAMRADRGDRSLGQKAADKVDDLKDRMDANPRSRPGPDPTDRDRRS